jgi:hypothetical protein
MVVIIETMVVHSRRPVNALVELQAVSLGKLNCRIWTNTLKKGIVK